MRYSEWTPTGFDTKGLGLENRQDWLVAPVLQHRDSGPLERSNFEVVVSDLGGESEEVEVHRFGHWAHGWFEIALCAPSLAEQVDEWERALADYPVADEFHYSNAEFEEFGESWVLWGAREFSQALAREFQLCPAADDAMTDATPDQLGELFQEVDGDYYSEDSGVSIETTRAASKVTRRQLARFLRDIRAAG